MAYFYISEVNFVGKISTFDDPLLKLRRNITRFSIFSIQGLNLWLNIQWFKPVDCVVE